MIKMKINDYILITPFGKKELTLKYGEEAINLFGSLGGINLDELNFRRHYGVSLRVGRDIPNTKKMVLSGESIESIYLIQDDILEEIKIYNSKLNLDTWNCQSKLKISTYGNSVLNLQIHEGPAVQINAWNNSKIRASVQNHDLYATCVTAEMHDDSKISGIDDVMLSNLLLDSRIKVKHIM